MGAWTPDSSIRRRSSSYRSMFPNMSTDMFSMVLMKLINGTQSPMHQSRLTWGDGRPAAPYTSCSLSTGLCPPIIATLALRSIVTTGLQYLLAASPLLCFLSSWMTFHFVNLGHSTRLAQTGKDQYRESRYKIGLILFFQDLLWLCWSVWRKDKCLFLHRDNSSVFASFSYVLRTIDIPKTAQ